MEIARHFKLQHLIISLIKECASELYVIAIKHPLI